MTAASATAMLRPASRLSRRAPALRHYSLTRPAAAAGPSILKSRAWFASSSPGLRFVSSSATMRAGAPQAGSSSAASTSPASNGEQPTQTMSQSEYERISEQDMDTLHENLEVVCEQYGPEEWEVEYSSGVMTLSLPPTGTWVINKQPPNQQIWMSSPLSGPSRFGYSPDGRWTHHRKPDVSLAALLEGEIRGLLQKEGIDDAEWEGVGLEK